MKMFYLMPLLFLTACSTAPKATLRPQPSSTAADYSPLRHPEVIHAYHFGRYPDPNDDSVMHEEHTVYRVEENSRWDLQPGGADVSPPTPRDVAFSPTPVNEAILAEVNSQRLATAQIRRESQTLSISLAQFQNAMQSAQTNFQQTAALRAMIGSLKQRLEALESARPAINISTTNELFDPLRP